MNRNLVLSGVVLVVAALPAAAMSAPQEQTQQQTYVLDERGVDPSGRVYYAEPLPAPIDEGQGAPIEVPALAGDVGVFALESLPGAQRTIVIDFDGHDVTGTAWNFDGVTGEQPGCDGRRPRNGSAGKDR
jgi:hypothetical protein